MKACRSGATGTSRWSSAPSARNPAPAARPARSTCARRSSSRSSRTSGRSGTGCRGGRTTMSMTVRSNGNVRILELSGEFTLADGALAKPLDLRGRRLDDLTMTLQTLVAQSPRVILLDLHGVTFLDSAALGELIAWKKRA